MVRLSHAKETPLENSAPSYCQFNTNTLHVPLYKCNDAARINSKGRKNKIETFTTVYKKNVPYTLGTCSRLTSTIIVQGFDMLVLIHWRRYPVQSQPTSPHVKIFMVRRMYRLSRHYVMTKLHHS